MKILIDTSYFLPLIKVGIENVSQSVLVNILSEASHEFFYSSLSIFELTAKGLKFSSQNNIITPQDIRIGIDAIQNDSRLKEKSFTKNPLIIELASQLKAIHNDTIDCLIFATAICDCDCIITMDVSFFDQIKKTPSLITKIKEIKKNFYFWFDDLSKELQCLPPIDS